jgi:two-component system alkaline phosphatase synthesis response regulator PhoP
METPLILVAEDERDIRELIVITLQTHGLTEVIQAPNGQEAVAMAKARVPAIILMDVRMPKMTGYEACEALKDDPSTSNIPIIFLSAKGQDAEIKRGIELGAEEYILKPFAPEELYARVIGILKRSGY